MGLMCFVKDHIVSRVNCEGRIGGFTIIFIFIFRLYVFIYNYKSITLFYLFLSKNVNKVKII